MNWTERLFHLPLRAGVVLTLCACLCCWQQQTSHAAVVALPFSQNFDGYAPSTDISATTFTESPTVVGSDMALGSNALQFSANATVNITNRYYSAAALQPSNLGSNAPFTMTTNFTMDTFSYGSQGAIAFGLVALAENSDFTTGRNYRVTYRPVDGKLLIGRNLNFTITEQSSSSSDTVLPVNGLMGSITVVGSYSLLGELTLSATMTSSALTVDGDNTLNATFTDPAPLTGQYFGLRAATYTFSTDPATLTGSFDNFSMTAVPEPATWSLLGLALGGGCFWYRRAKSR